MLTEARVKIKHIILRYVAPLLMEEGSRDSQMLTLKITHATTDRKAHHRAAAEFPGQVLSPGHQARAYPDGRMESHLLKKKMDPEGVLNRQDMTQKEGKSKS